MTDKKKWNDCDECGEPYDAWLMADDTWNRQVGAICLGCGHWWTGGRTHGATVFRRGVLAG
jgi:hypothetical protein